MHFIYVRDNNIPELIFLPSSEVRQFYFSSFVSFLECEVAVTTFVVYASTKHQKLVLITKGYKYKLGFAFVDVHCIVDRTVKAP